MIFSHQDVDTWAATIHRQLGQVDMAVLDLIDIGPAEHIPVSRHPSTVEKDATWRAGDVGDTDSRFHYEPTPRSSGRRSGISRPVEAATVAWEASVQEAVTSVFAGIALAIETVCLLRVVPRDEDGRPLPPPDEPATREILHGRRAGQHLVDVDPASCRRHLLAAVRYLGASVDATADAMRGADGDMAEFVDDRRQRLGHVVGALARRLEVGDRPRLCGCGCRRPAPPVGAGATRQACRKRLERANKSA